VSTTMAERPRANARGTCTIDGCDRPHYGKGWCNPHYQRWRRRKEEPAATVVRPVDPVDPVDRFWTYVDKETARTSTGCWLWTGPLVSNGYARHSAQNQQVLAHRFAYELLVGPIPEGLQLDHVWARGCRHLHCVNPAHLEPVTGAENVRRAERTRRTHCPQGHLYDETNTYWRKDRPGNRQCRACANGARRSA
jgi:hypothetical protein